MATFNTTRLKELTAYAIRGAGFNKLLELSSYMGIRVSDGIIYLNTTDGTNYLSVSDACDADDMDITVDAELFSKLIGKLNSDTVDMDIVDNTLVIKGNGKYTLELVPDEDGGLLSFPNKFPDKVEDIGKIPATDLILISTAVKTSLGQVAGSVYSNYYFGDVVASTDKAMMSIFKRKLFDGAYLFNREFVDLLCMSGADVTVSKCDDMLLAESSISEKGCICVCTKIQTNVNEFGIDNINKFAALEVKSFCRVHKVELLALLDRLSLFVNKFDDGAIELHFTDNYIEVSSLANNGVERVEYQESKDAQDITIKINIERLRNQLKAYSSDVVDLYYGSEICIKLVDGDMTQVIALIK